MPGGVTTSRALIIAPNNPETLPQVNAYLRGVDPTSTGDALTTPLRTVGDTTNAIAAYWCSWAMDETDRNELRKGLRQIGQDAILTPDDPFPAWDSARPAYVFDGVRFTDPFDVARRLGLDLLADEE